ncbi:hypothetical protein SUDANB114_03767 [Nocardiopsis dassonvillei]
MLLVWRALALERTHSSSSLSRLAFLASFCPSTFRRALLGLQVDAVVALVGVELAPVQLQDPRGDVVQEVPVVCDRDDGARVLGQVLLQPVHTLGVEVVGGLVEQQQVGLLQQELAQGHAALLATGELGDGGVAGRATQRVHRLLQLAVQVPGAPVVELLLELAHLLEQVVGVVRRHLLGDLVEAGQHRLGLGDAVLDVLQDGLVRVEVGFLREQSDGETGHEPRLAVGRLLDAGHDLQKRRLTRTVGAHDADLGSGQERPRNVVQDDFVAVRLAHVVHGVDVLRHESKPRVSRPMPPPWPGPAGAGSGRRSRPRRPRLHGPGR